MASTQYGNDSTWVTPRTWTTNELVTATLLNTHLRDQLSALKTKAHKFVYIDEAADYTTTSTSFVDVDATDLSLTVVTAGGDLKIGFTGTIDNSGANLHYLDVDIDGTRVGGDDGLIVTAEGAAGERQVINFTCWKSGLSAASHIIKLQWKVAAGTSTMYAGAGTSTFDVHPFFWVEEVG